MRRKGVLGLEKAKEVNLSYMMKLAWPVVKEPNKLWVKVMRQKYRYGSDILLDIRKESKPLMLREALPKCGPISKIT